ncbi:unnamed protein product [Cladocopium goreaui]|uniref:ATP-dependent 6-phosphofructokinase 5, chloroplastic (ATP-PFK 5) (Phosphofructokinase 5) (Phosphohexokinase 5) n=1 Tax=Cladocopium goreaui TaxID=2562237 RepID=A0A9P1G307_9DINO|nr:unnamed protein product [Cladocopium goreaui]
MSQRVRNAHGKGAWHGDGYKTTVVLTGVPRTFDEYGTRLPTSEVFQPWREAYHGWRSSETHQAQGDAGGKGQWQYQEKWYGGGDLYDKPRWNGNSSAWFGGSPKDQCWQSDHGSRENYHMDRTWERDHRSWDGSVRWDGTAAGLSVPEEARDITPWGLQEVEGFGDAASNGTGATDQDPKGSASEQIPLDAPKFCEATLASLAVTNYACPKCSACFAKWSACHRHIFSEAKCRKEVAETGADQDLQAICKAKAQEFPADEFRNGRNGHSNGPQHARDCISAAYVEATCNANCIGMVKLLGANSGFLAMNATMAARNVDICLLPEMEIDLEKVLLHCEEVMSSKGYAVIVVADGAKQSLSQYGMAMEGDVGPWLRDQVLARFKEKGKPLTIKYIDPTYMVRSVKANAYDSAYASALAEHAVHGAMAGLTCVSVVRMYSKTVYIPIHACVTHAKRVNPLGRWFGRMAFTTGQPRFEPAGFKYPPMPKDGAEPKPGVRKGRLWL